MRSNWWTRLPLLVVVGGLLVFAGVELLVSEENDAAVALFAASLIVLGAWVSLEVGSVRERERRGDDDDGGKDC